LKAYKTQRIPYRAAPASLFSFATLSAFSDILQVVTAPWQEDQIKGWNNLVTVISEAVSGRNKQVIEERENQQKRNAKLAELRKEKRILEELCAQHKRELERTQQAYERELARVPQRYEGEVSAVSPKKAGPPQPKFLGFSRRLLALLVVAFAVLGLV